MNYSSSRYDGLLNALRNSPYTQEFVYAIAIAGSGLGLVTEDYASFITTENGNILTTEG